jgi:Mg-chelatase subunit ChlD
MKHILRSYSVNENGNTAVLFGYSLMSLALAAGVVLDYTRISNAKTSITAIADAAAIAAVSSIDSGEEAMKTAAANYIDANVEALGIELKGEPNLTYDSNKSEFTVEIVGEVQTSLMAVAGYSSMDIEGKSVAIRPGVPPIEMVLSLDTTGSMAGTKMTALKTAATKMVTAVLKNNKAKVGIVPFATYVNVGTSRRNNEYFNVPADYLGTRKDCKTTYPNKTGCSIVSTNTSCTGSNDGVPYTYACKKDTETCTSWGAAVAVCTDVDHWYKFYGCLGSREENMRAKVSDSTKKYPSMTNTGCSAEIQTLTSDLSALKKKITALSASGETYLPGGLTWGWNMLTSQEPLTEAETATTLAAKGGRKILVLMTDGATTLVPIRKEASGHNTTIASVYKSLDYSNTLSAELCTAIKNDGIDIYTVQFDVVDISLQQLLTNCATSPEMSFQATSSDDLVEAFDRIVLNLSQIRIAR